MVTNAMKVNFDCVRRVEGKEEELAALRNEVLVLEDLINLSQMFLLER